MRKILKMFYSGKCIGRVINFLRIYMPFEADNVQIGQRHVELYGKTIATFHWFIHKEYETDLPIFQFSNENYSENQRARILEAIERSWGYPRINVGIKYGYLSSEEDVIFLGNVENELPFRRKENIDVYFEKAPHTYYIAKDNKEISTYQFFSPKEFDIEKEMDFRAHVVLFGKYWFKEELKYEDSKASYNCGMC